MNMDSPMPGDFWYETAGLKISHFLQSFLRESGMASWSLVRASEQRHDPGKNCTNCKSCIFQSDSPSWRITYYQLLSNPSPLTKVWIKQKYCTGPNTKITWAYGRPPLSFREVSKVLLFPNGSILFDGHNYSGQWTSLIPARERPRFS